MTAEPDLLPLPDVKRWRAMKDRNGNVGYSDKPDPKYSESAATDGLTWVRLNDHTAAMHDYARANVAHATAARDAEVEALRAEVAHVVAGMNAALDKVIEHRNARHDAEARAERLAEALRGWIWARENGASEELAVQYARASLEQESNDA